jgi:hypothetical protein
VWTTNRSAGRGGKEVGVNEIANFGREKKEGREDGRGEARWGCWWWDKGLGEVLWIPGVCLKS